MAATATQTGDGLTAKQAMFVREYVVDLNGTQAAIRAGYSKETAAEQATRLLRNVKVRAAINAALEERTKRVEIDADWVLKRLVDEASADIADLIDADTGGLKAIHDWPKIWRSGLVAGIEIEEEYGREDAPDDMEPQGHGGALRRQKPKVAIGRVSKIKFSDRHKKLEAIGRHVNVNAFKNVIDGKVDVNPTQALLDAIGGSSIRPVTDA